MARKRRDLAILVAFLLAFAGHCRSGGECNSNGIPGIDDDLCITKDAVSEEESTTFPTKAVRHIRGRLGNHLAGYMMALTLSMRYARTLNNNAINI